MSGSAAEVVNNEAESRFELAIDGGTAIAAYERDSDVLTFMHTHVPADLEGRGVGTTLIDGALADVRARHLKIIPACSFVRAYVQAHPAVRDLVA